EGVLDPQVAAWFAANPMFATPLEELEPELLALARGPVGAPPTRAIAHVGDDTVDGVPVRVYRHDGSATGVVVYFHGGGFCVGSVGLMDNVARELAHASGATVVSVEYRLAPEHRYPAGLDDCDAVTRWALAHAGDLGGTPGAVAVAGESAGGNLSAAVALRRRDAGGAQPCAQVLIYPGVGGTRDFPSRAAYSGYVISERAGEAYWGAYSGGRDLTDDPYAAPLAAPSLAGLPPALVVLGGCDMLRDEGRAYARRMADDGVAVDEVCIAGQPHGFVNFDLPAAALAHDRIGTWLRARFADVRI
ncbi:MAG: alpha/beta hydrolase, partial [Actinomycetota bacterium]